MRENKSSASLASFAAGLLLVSMAALILIPSFALAATTPVTFNFDTSTPPLNERTNIPFNQTSAGMTAYFSSTPDPAKFSLQSIATNPNLLMSWFSGKYLYDNSPSTGDSIDMKFSIPLSSINFTFATFEFHGAPGLPPSNITLTAYMDSNSSLLPWRNSTYLPPVGSASAYGVWPTNDTYPEGTLSYNSSQQFNLVRIQLPYQGPNGAVGFALDNVVATDFTAIPEFSPFVLGSLLLANTALVMLIIKKKPFKTRLTKST